jgi:preprotein translocase subunit YajC
MLNVRRESNLINWEVVLWTCITVGVLAGVGAIILIFISAKNVKKRSSELKNIHIELKTGMKIMFCGGVYGKVVKVADETVEVEVSKNVVITISRYSIQGVV